MEMGMNFVDCFPNDVVCKIMSYLDDSSDLIRATAVSRSWCHFVISNCLSKKMCSKKVPALASIACVVEENNGIVKMLEDVLLRNCTDLETLEKEHKVYSSLLGVLVKPIRHPQECMALTVGVLSSTDCDAAENILNVLHPLEKSPFRIQHMSGNHNVPEHIIYQLETPTCIVQEIHILPFEDTSYSFPVNRARRWTNWRHRWGIFSGKSVRFRMGHPKSSADLVEIGGSHVRPSQQPSLDNYVWTYTSPVFSMDQSLSTEQDSDVHQFKLPEPTICMGGFLHVEVIDRIYTEEVHGFLCIYLGRVSVIGVPLEPAFKLEMIPSRGLELKYCPFNLKMEQSRRKVLNNIPRVPKFRSREWEGYYLPDW